MTTNLNANEDVKAPVGPETVEEETELEGDIERSEGEGMTEPAVPVPPPNRKPEASIPIEADLDDAAVEPQLERTEEERAALEDDGLLEEENPCSG